MIILSIETSCDETAVSIVDFRNDKAVVLSNIISSQIKTHKKYGGVVPSLASRMHLKNLPLILGRAFREAGIAKNKIDYVSVVEGPGLIPALIVGVNGAKALSYALGKPLVGINHIEGHIYSNWLEPAGKFQISNFKFQNFKVWKPKFPVLCLTVSGGHTQLILMKKDLNYKIIGETLDDAAGEAFDKVAKLLELGYPGGPLIEKLARKGDKTKFEFPRPMLRSGDFNFSFSGLKTAILYEIRSKKNTPHPNLLSKGEGSILGERYKADIAASFQQAVIDVLVAKTISAAKKHKAKNIILGGGVSANKELKKQLGQKIRKEFPLSVFRFPQSSLTTDNALMIAVAAYFHVLKKKGISNWAKAKADANLKLNYESRIVNQRS